MRNVTIATLLLLAVGNFCLAQSPQADSTGSPHSSSAPPAQKASATDSPDVAAARKQFEAADLAGKLKIIDDHSSRATAEWGPLYQYAVEYLLKNLHVLRSDAMGNELGMKSVKLLGAVDYKPASDSVWRLFQGSTNTGLELASLDALSVIAQGKPALINQMNHWLAGQNLLHATGASVDPLVIDGCVRALGSLQESASFAVLFNTAQADFGEPITGDARNALKQLKGDLSKQLLQVMETSRFPARVAALEAAMKESKLTTDQKAAIATAALKAALSDTSGSQGSSGAAAELRFRAAGALGSLDWTPAAGLLLTNFSQATKEYSRGKISAAQLILSANALAAMATHEAAVRLTLYLNLINSLTDEGRAVDHSITLAIVNDLGKLGDSVAFDTLYTVQYLDYPDSIKAAAAQAAHNLADR